MFDWFKKKELPSQPPHVPIELILYRDFNGDVVACAKWYVKNYKESQWSDLIMMQVLLIERMTKLDESKTDKQD